MDIHKLVELLLNDPVPGVGFAPPYSLVVKQVVMEVLLIVCAAEFFATAVEHII